MAALDPPFHGSDTQSDWLSDRKEGRKSKAVADCELSDTSLNPPSQTFSKNNTFITYLFNLMKPSSSLSLLVKLIIKSQRVLNITPGNPAKGIYLEHTSPVET